MVRVGISGTFEKFEKGRGGGGGGGLGGVVWMPRLKFNIILS